MKTDYDYYCLGCEASGVNPVNSWHFHNAYAKYQSEFHKALDECVDLLPAKERGRIVGRWTRLIRLAGLVELGQRITELTRRWGGDGEPGTEGAGTREPRIPRTPVLAGSAARPLPVEDAVKEQYGWRF